MKSADDSITVYRYSPRKGFISILVALVFVFGLFIFNTKIKLAGYIILFIFILIILIFSFYLFAYSVRVDMNGITINRFNTSKFLFTQIRIIELNRFKASRFLSLDVTLDNGKVYTFPSEIENFKDLVETLNKYHPIDTTVLLK